MVDHRVGGVIMEWWRMTASSASRLQEKPVQESITSVDVGIILHGAMRL